MTDVDKHLINILPENLRTRTTESVTTHTFDNFLSGGHNTTNVVGYIGKRNPDAQVSRCIKESDPHRQAFQLSSAMVTKVGSERQVMSYDDFMSRLKKGEIDIGEVANWARSQSFNFLPPINTDKLVNYADYFWVDEDDPTSPQSYVVIKNPCAESSIALKQKQKIVDNLIQNPPTNTTLQTPTLLVHDGNISNIITVGTNISFGVPSTTTTGQVRGVVLGVSYDGNTNVTKIELSPFESPNSTLFVVDTVAAIQNTMGTVQNQLAYATDDVDRRWWKWNDSTSFWSQTTAPTAQLDYYDAISYYISQNNQHCLHATGWDSAVWDSTKWDETLSNTYMSASTPWAKNNKWVHKKFVLGSAVGSRAQYPIIEYDDNIEMTRWVKVTHNWSNRPSAATEWTDSTTQPTLLELAPATSPIFTAHSMTDTSGSTHQVLKMYVKGSSLLTNRSINYSLDGSLLPNTEFTIVLGTTQQNVRRIQSKVLYSEFRQIGTSLPSTPGVVPTDFFNIVTFESLLALTPQDITNLTSNTQTAYVEPSRVSGTSAPWLTYGVHWRYDGRSVAKVAGSTPTAAHFVEWSTTQSSNLINTSSVFSPHNSVMEWNEYAQTVSITQPSDTFDIHPSLREHTVDGIRVFVDGNLVDPVLYQTVPGSPTVTAVTVFDPLHSNQPIQLSSTQTPITQIKFDAAIAPATVGGVSEVRFEMGQQIDENIGRTHVRQWTEPANKSINLENYLLFDQTSSNNQYPVFNVYDVITDEVIHSSSLWKYETSPNNPIHPQVQQRVYPIRSQTGPRFINELTNDDNVVYGYRALSPNPTPGVEKLGDSAAFAPSRTHHRYVTINGLMCAQQIISGLSYPHTLVGWDVSQYVSLWTLDSDVLKPVNHHVTTAPSELTHPTQDIFTVWKTHQGSVYVPHKVDADGNIVPSTSPDFSEYDYEIVHQWAKNPQHLLKKQLTLPEVLPHFASIIAAQPIGTAAGVISHPGNGGWIKEYDRSFDKLISVMNHNDLSIGNVLSFALKEYINTDQELLNTYMENIMDIVNNSNNPTTTKAQIIQKVSQNSRQATLFFDSGVDSLPHTLASPALLRLATPTPPLIIRGSTGKPTAIRKHSGDMLRLDHTSVSTSLLLKAITDTPTNFALPQLPPPTTALSTLGGRLVPGSIFLNTLTNQLYRFVADYVSDVMLTPLPIYPNNSVLYVKGTSTTYRMLNGAWVSTSDSLWEPVDTTTNFANLMYDIEMDLYNECQRKHAPVFGTVHYAITDLTLSPSELEYKNTLLQQTYRDFCKKNNISTDATPKTYDQFTWNYTHLGYTDPQTNQSLSTWKAIYTHLYGTPYVTSEPWVLQGYPSQPSWWNQVYLVNGQWIDAMWNNIMLGILPTQPNILITPPPLPTGVSIPQYQNLPVNRTNAIVGGKYHPGQLLPPQLSVSTNNPSANEYKVMLDGNWEEYQESSQFIFDWNLIKFKLRPLEYLAYSYGDSIKSVNHLPVDTLTKTVPSNYNALMHGDWHNDQMVYIRGVGQWLINYARERGMLSDSQLHAYWRNWTPKLTYRTNNIIRSEQLNVHTKLAPLTQEDFSIHLASKITPREVDASGLVIVATKIPRPTPTSNTTRLWEFEVQKSNNEPITLCRPIVSTATQTSPNTIRITPVSIAALTTAVPTRVILEADDKGNGNT